MKIFKSRKAFGQIDWPISMGFFLIYLVWFFVIISPIAKPPKEAQHPALDLLQEKFEEEANWELIQAPIIVRSAFDDTREPIVANLPLNYSQENSYMYNHYFIIDGGRVLLLGEVNGNSFFNLLKTDKTYNLPTVTSDLSGDASYSQVTSENFRADLTNGLLDTITYNARTRISDLDIYVDTNIITISDNDFNSTSIVNIYKVNGLTSNTHYIFGDNSRVHSFVRTSSPGNVLVDIDLGLYTDYYVSPGDFNNVNYGSSTCTERLGDYITFYDANDALTFLLSEDVNIEICNTPTTLSVGFNQTIDGDLGYYAIFHSGDEDEGLNYSQKNVEFGVFETIDGLSRDNLDLMQLKSYGQLKSDWGFPVNSDFKIIVYNSTSTLDNTSKLLEIGNDAYDLAEVSVKTVKTDIIDQYNQRQRATVNLRVWT